MSILGVGHCTLEHYGVVDRFLDPGLKREMSTFSVQGGGSAATSTVVPARWGAPTRFCGAVGDDGRGDTIERTLADEGIDTDDMIRQSEAVSQLTFTILEESSGQKQTLYTRGSVTPLARESAETVEVDDISLMIFDGLEPDFQLELAERADDRGVPILLHASEMKMNETAKRLVELSNYLVASERFATRLTGRGELDALCRALLEYETRAAIVTMGRDGVAGAWEGEMRVRADAYEVDVVDNSGAGDVFAGAFAYGLHEEWSLDRAVRFANVAGALSCRGIGPRSAIPDFGEVERHLGST